MKSLKGIIHKQWDSIDKLFPEWDRLKEDFYEMTIFQDKSWIESWWTYKSGQTKISPYIVEIKEGDETIGIIPLYLSKIRRKKIYFRVLKPIGSELSDYLIPILSKKYSPDTLLHLAFKKIYEDKVNWDYIEWGEVPEDSFFAQLLITQQLENSTLIKIKEADVCPYLPLNGNMEDTMRKFNHKFLKEILRLERKLNREGIYKYSKAVQEEEIEPLMNKFFELHCERWENTETPSKFRNKAERDHAMLAAKNLFKKKLLHLAYLSYNDEILVVHFGMTDGKRSYLYLHAINIKYKKYSPGSLIAYNLILEAHRDGLEIVDFLRGDEGYKQLWGTQEKYNIEFKLFNRTVKALLFRSLEYTDQSDHLLIKYPVMLAKRLLSRPVEQ